MNQLRLPLHLPKLIPLRYDLPKGSKVLAAIDIHFADGTTIEAGRPGVVESGGSLACNIRFKRYPHLVLCFWDMLAEVKP